MLRHCSKNGHRYSSVTSFVLNLHSQRTLCNVLRWKRALRWVSNKQHDKQDRQWTNSVTMIRVRLTNVAVESSNYYTFWVCVCSLRYTASSAHVSYYIVICGISDFPKFSHIISWRHDLRVWWRGLLNTLCVFWFSLQYLSEIFSIWRKIQRDIITILHRSSSKVRVVRIRY